MNKEEVTNPKGFKFSRYKHTDEISWRINFDQERRKRINLDLQPMD